MTDPAGHRAKKSLGQNFLKDANICRKIVEAHHGTIGAEAGARKPAGPERRS